MAASSATMSVSSLTGMITVRLTRENFLLWKTQAGPALRAAHLFGYIDGTIQAPAAEVTEGTGDAAIVITNPEFLKWFQQDQIVMIALLSSMSEDILGQMSSYTNSKQVWDALHSMFSSQGRARVMQLRYQLSNLKMKDMSASEYNNKMKGYADTMSAIGHTLTEEEILGYMLAGLGPEYEPLVVALTALDDVISLNSSYADRKSVV